MCALSTGTGLLGNTMSIRLANFDHKASLSLREPHKLGWKLADHIPGDGPATELLVFEQFVYLYCNHSQGSGGQWTEIRADRQQQARDISRLRQRQSHDGDCRVSSLSLGVWPPSWCPHLQPDTDVYTGTQSRPRLQIPKTKTALWWVLQVTVVRVSSLQMETLLDWKRHWVLVTVLFNGQELVRWQELWTKYHKHFWDYHQQYIFIGMLEVLASSSPQSRA